MFQTNRRLSCDHRQSLTRCRRVRSVPFLPAALVLIVCAGFSATHADDWTTLAVPGAWEKIGGDKYVNLDGSAWYRCVVTLPTHWQTQKRPLVLLIGGVDDSCDIYVNGASIGSLKPKQGDAKPSASEQSLAIPPTLVGKRDSLELAIRVVDASGIGGFVELAPALVAGDEAIVLQGPWGFLPSDGFQPVAPPVPSTDQGKNADKGVSLSPRNSNIPRFHHVVPRKQLSRRSKAILDQGLSPADSQKQFKIGDELAVDVLLTEPEVRQPVFASFDHKGRLWVMQYLQYPEPAGLKMLAKDGYFRATYDRVPMPPPKGERGLDRITIHEDRDHDGRFETHRTFVDGLNIATSFAVTATGVWVLNPPYLLFYPDANQDDVPDGPPEVHLEGFGLEDTHSVVNSLQMGPDGWLYAAQGSTVTAAVKQPGSNVPPTSSMGQLIWRYHPITRQYEIFAEGGGNAFGLEMDDAGRIFSGHNGGDTRGFHYVQGGYSQKGFNKHGPLSNPFALGYFLPMKHHNVPRFTHAFAIVSGKGMPSRYQEKLFGIAPLLHHVVISDLTPTGATFATKDQGYAIESADPWFTPVAIYHAPDGSLIVCDWYDGQCAHYRHYEGQIDKSNGRIYRIRSKSAGANCALDMTRLSDAELIQSLRSETRWQRRAAVEVLASRPSAKQVVPSLIEQLSTQADARGLDLLWAVHRLGGFDQATARLALSHPQPKVRLWAVRLLGDQRTISPELMPAVLSLADDPDVEVRAQVACSAKRLSFEQALPIVMKLARDDRNADDPFVPLLVWWALEQNLSRDAERTVKQLTQTLAGQQSDKPIGWRMMREHLASRIMQRLVLSERASDVQWAGLLFAPKLTPMHDAALDGLELATESRSLDGLPAELLAKLASRQKSSLFVRLRQGEPSAISEAIQQIEDPKVDRRRRIRCIEVASTKSPDALLPVLIKLIESSSDQELVTASWIALPRFAAAPVGKLLTARLRTYQEDLRAVALETAASRKAWTTEVLNALEAKQLDSSSITNEFIDRLSMHGEPIITQAQRIFGSRIKLPDPSAGPQRTSSPQTMKKIDAILELAGSNLGTPKAGKQIFAQRCQRCHTLFAVGAAVGPDLTSYRRQDLPNLVRHIVDPNVELREGFVPQIVETEDGRLLTGIMVESLPNSIKLRGGDGREINLPRSEIVSLKPSTKSLMPEGILDDLSPGQIRDLLAYLRSSQPNVD